MVEVYPNCFGLGIDLEATVANGRGEKGLGRTESKRKTTTG